MLERKRERGFYFQKISYYLQKLITQDSDVSSAILNFIFAPSSDGSGILF